MARENRYEGIDDYAVGLIRYFARRLATGKTGYSEGELDDLEQELAIHYMRQIELYDEGRGASRKTFTSTIIRNHALSLVYKNKAAKRDHRLVGQVPEDDAEIIDSSAVDEERLGARVDIMRAVSRLSPAQRDLWGALVGATVKGVADERKVHRSTVHDQRNRLRERLREVGLDAYAPDPTDRDPSE